MKIAISGASGKTGLRIVEECKKSGNTSNLRPLLREILHVFHPFAPFITEEISNLLFKERII